MRNQNSGITDLGPAPKSSAEWLLTRRPGRHLDAAAVGLGPAPRRRNRVVAFLTGAFASLIRS